MLKKIKENVSASCSSLATCCRAELDKDANIHPIATTQAISQGLEFLIKRCVEDSGQETKRRALKSDFAHLSYRELDGNKQAYGRESGSVVTTWSL